MVLQDTRFKEFASGLGAAFITLVTTYPINKCVYRQILENAKMQDSLLRMKKEGFRHLYRGIGPLMIQRCTELSSLFGVYKTAEIALQPLHLYHYQTRLASGAIAGMTTATLTPLERIQVLLLDSRNNHRFRHMADVTYIIANQYGFKEFYRGFTILLIRDVLQNMFFFTLKEKLYEIMNHQKDLQGGIENFVVGSITGICAAAVFYPLKVVKVHIQQQLGGKFENISNVTKTIYGLNNRGVTNFYRGLTLNIVRAFFSWGITNLCYEFLRNHI